jgi:hypothetical protein
MSYQKNLDSIIGKQVAEVGYIVHTVQGGTLCRIALILGFGEGNDLTIRSAADGVGLICASEVPEEGDLGQYGVVKFMSSKDYDPDRAHRLIGKKVVRVEPDFDRAGRIIYLQIAFTDIALSANNDDDDLVISVA